MYPSVVANTAPVVDARVSHTMMDDAENLVEGFVERGRQSCREYREVLNERREKPHWLMLSALRGTANSRR